MSHAKESSGGLVPAKLKPPRLSAAVYRRKRLYREVKRVLKAGAALWVQGPAGAGKTTLVASYLDAERQRAVWYHLEAGDAEPASFFRHMRLTLAELGGDEQVPVFDARLGQDPTRFAREFFRAYLARVPPDTVIVLDDYHEVEGEGSLDGIVAVVLGELPKDRHLVVISRGAVPGTLARALADGRIEGLGRDALRLDDDEARHIAHLRLPRKNRPNVSIEEFNHRAQGWVAGLILMVQQAVTGAGDGGVGVPTPETLSEYFGNELFGAQEHDALNVLTALSFFPHFTPAMAEALVDEPHVPALISDLYRRNFFLTRYQTATGDITYRLHPLFRDFLRQVALERNSEEARREITLRVAEILAGEGEVGEAVHLYQSAQAWSQIERLLLAEASGLYQRGEFHTLRGWLAKMPESQVRGNGWLSLWRGAVLAVDSAAAGRSDLENAYTLFRRADDLDGALLAWCTLVEGHVFEWGDLHPLDEWIQAFDELEPALAQAPPPIVQRATFAMFGAVSYRQPFGPVVDHWAQRAEQVFAHAGEPVIRALMASHLAMFHCFSRGRLGRAAAFVNEIKAQDDRGPANPVADVVFLVHYAVISLWNTGNAALSLDSVRRGIETAKVSGVHMLDFLLYAAGAWCALSGGDYVLAEQYIEGLGRAFNHDALLNRCIFHDTLAILNLHLGNVDVAQAQAEMSLELARRGGMPYAESACLLTASRARSLAGDWDGAAAFRQRAAAIADAMDNRFILNHLSWFEAADRLQRDGGEAALAPLREALGGWRAGNFFGNLWLDRGSFARLCHVALVHDIETDYVRRLIACTGLTAEDTSWGRDGWPFRLRIEVLSGLRVETLTENDYRSVSVQGRGAQLLEALVWLGGRSVDQEQLADILWPDAEGDAARRSFDTTLHRLRRTLGDERLLLLEGGRLSLDPGLVWTDVGALEAARQALVHAVQADAEPEQLEALQQALIENVSGLLKHGAAGRGPSEISANLRRDLERTLDRAGRCLKQLGAWDPAIAAFETRLRLNPAAEAASLQLMHIYLERGLPSEAMIEYQKCKENVNKYLGLAPGPEVEAMRGRLAAFESNIKER